MPTSASAYEKRMQEIRAEFPRAYERWSEQDEALLLQEYRLGQSTAELSRMLRRQPSAIKSRLRKLTIAYVGLAQTPEELPSQMAPVPPPMTTMYEGHIEITPGVRGGKPRLAGTRLTVDDVVVMHLRLGESLPEITGRYDLDSAAVYAAMAYY